MKTLSVSSSRPGESPEDFRILLRNDLARRCSRNPRYTLRTFAHYLGVDHSTLSQLLRGKRRVTPTTVRKLGTRLGLAAELIERLADAAAKPVEASGAEPLCQLTRDAADVLADWRPFAILELTQLECFVPNTGWIARVLGISADEVNIALQQLIRLGMLELQSPTSWVDRLGNATATERDFALATIDQLGNHARRHHDRAVAARPHYHGSTTFAIRADQAARVVDRLAGLEREVAGVAVGPADQVYRLAIHFFPLSDA